jgi:hypothetical protein
VLWCSGGSPAGRPALPRMDPDAQRPRTMSRVPAQDRDRSDQQPQPLTTRFGRHAEQRREQSPLRPGRD